jgi:hypothetical protein
MPCSRRSFLAVVIGIVLTGWDAIAHHRPGHNGGPKPKPTTPPPTTPPPTPGFYFDSYGVAYG